jgi:hypothetical protein
MVSLLPTRKLGGGGARRGYKEGNDERREVPLTSLTQIKLLQGGAALPYRGQVRHACAVQTAVTCEGDKGDKGE